MPFRITGLSPAGLIDAKRIQAGSALMLATRWTYEGVREVRITDNSGQGYDIDGFRARLAIDRPKFMPF